MGGVSGAGMRKAVGIERLKSGSRARVIDPYLFLTQEYEFRDFASLSFTTKNHFSSRSAHI
jgi:hypothetical protein